MTEDEYNAFCAALPGATHAVQWGDHHVWKVGGKIFAVAAGEPGKAVRVSFKASDIAFEMLKDRPGLRPAPYLASRGLKWIQLHGRPGLSDRDLGRYIAESHRLVAAGLSRKARTALGLEPAPPAPRRAPGRG
jgi:predicted DNA-binding protein (MmcQ/YjbR family)